MQSRGECREKMALLKRVQYKLWFYGFVELATIAAFLLRVARYLFRVVLFNTEAQEVELSCVITESTEAILMGFLLTRTADCGPRTSGTCHVGYCDV